MKKTLIVVDTNDWPDLELAGCSVIDFETYLTEYPKKNAPTTTIINLCDTEHYLSQGYYCSLLAEARQHKVMPSVKQINSLRTKDEEVPVYIDVPEHIAKGVHKGGDHFIYFGKTEDSAYTNIAALVFQAFPLPLLKIEWLKPSSNNSIRVSVQRAALSSLTNQQKNAFWNEVRSFTERTWSSKAKRKQLRWDMAILVNPDEPNPPSDEKALNAFIKAARKVSINATLITQSELSSLARFDALFLRETTAIDHPTYRLAVEAENQGLVVIDDPQSILRCCNKVFLHDAFNYQGIPTPKTRILHRITDDTLLSLAEEFAFPMVLKLPEGSFSKGVFKVNDAQELREKLTEMFSVSALVLVQEYMYTDFDWRIGVLNGRALYACRYEMARNHWQIYNHNAKRGISGGFKTLPTFEVPKSVLDVAIKASNIIGKSLYGVDIKVKNNKPYVLEVNDNPSIEHKVEDAYLGNELYMQVMTEFRQRLEARGRP
ncbi:ATP-grasp domain-containing protein [Alteromonas sediminis]|uniref:ATP-grasp domain-containing protein n=1 Tax=Alteromonas sediminis TaxID=2259342 RepID=A0A3N5XZ88_9ALTE|nr:RimK family protein [Alteromonas sediminis]RPJ65813.1 ATP-grasp domain-containing protein [Alteromonas sediminis]